MSIRALGLELQNHSGVVGNPVFGAVEKNALPRAVGLTTSHGGEYPTISMHFYARLRIYGYGSKSSSSLRVAVIKGPLRVVYSTSPNHYCQKGIALHYHQGTLKRIPPRLHPPNTTLPSPLLNPALVSEEFDLPLW